MVHKGDVLAQIDPRPFNIQLLSAQAARAKDQALAHDAQINFERMQSLSDQGVASKQQLEDARAQKDQYVASLLSDEATIESARLNLDYARIISPVDGVTGVRLTDPGNIVHAADQTGIVVVTQLDPTTVIFSLPQDFLPAIIKGQKIAPLNVDAFSRDGSQVLAHGELATIDNQVNAATATIRLKAVFKNPDLLLWPNAFVKARLRLQTKPLAIVIPSAALQQGPSGSFVFVVGDDKRVNQRAVVVSLVQDDDTILEKGVQPGEVVVVEGQAQVRNGSLVSSRQTDTSPSASAAPSASTRASGSHSAKGSHSGTTP
jgi:multidrug efflux system membrane fusion protein